MSIERQILQKIYGKIDIDEATMCWRYTGGNNGKDYGRVYARGKLHGVHRLIYEIFHGPVPEGKEVHHVCCARSCCNPAHLRLVSHRENTALTQANETLRLQRLQLFIDEYPQLEFVGSMTVSSTKLASLWSCRSNNVPDYLDTLAFLYGAQFQWEMIERGRGQKPSIFRIRIDPALVKELEASDSHSPVDVLSQMSILPVAV